MFDESGFEIYQTRGLVDIKEEEKTGLSCDLEAKLNMNEALDQVRTHYFELSKLTDSLDLDEKERLLKR